MAWTLGLGASAQQYAIKARELSIQEARRELTSCLAGGASDEQCREDRRGVAEQQNETGERLEAYGRAVVAWEGRQGQAGNRTFTDLWNLCPYMVINAL